MIRLDFYTIEERKGEEKAMVSHTAVSID